MVTKNLPDDECTFFVYSKIASDLLKSLDLSVSSDFILLDLSLIPA